MSPWTRTMGLLWLGGGLLHLGAMTAALALIYAYGRIPKRTVLALPLTLLMTVAIFLRGLWMSLTGRVTWSGVKYVARESAASQARGKT